MSVESTIYGVLSADATLLALATGGVWSFDQTGEKGINRTLTPAAFDANDILKPCILVSQRNANPEPSIQDDTGQTSAVRHVCELYFFQDSGYSTIETMKARCYTLLHAQRLTGMVRTEWAGDVRLGRDIDLNAFVERVDYLNIYIRSGS